VRFGCTSLRGTADILATHTHTRVEDFFVTFPETQYVGQMVRCDWQNCKS